MLLKNIVTVNLIECDAMHETLEIDPQTYFCYLNQILVILYN